MGYAPTTGHGSPVRTATHMACVLLASVCAVVPPMVGGCHVYSHRWNGERRNDGSVQSYDCCWGAGPRGCGTGPVCPARMNRSACRRLKQSLWLRHRARRCRGQNVPLSDRRNVAILVVHGGTTRKPVRHECGQLVADSRMRPDVVDLGLCPFAVWGRRDETGSSRHITAGIRLRRAY